MSQQSSFRYTQPGQPQAASVDSKIDQKEIKAMCSSIIQKKMGKTSRHSNKNKTQERLFVQNARQPTAAVHDPIEDVSICNVFGNVRMLKVEGACSDRAVQYIKS